MKAGKIFLIFVLAILISAPVFAASTMAVVWEWLLDDPDVAYYRYQLDGEDPDGWTVLPGDVNQLVLTNLSPAESYTLHLQRSYDGELWSESGISTADGFALESSDSELSAPAPIATPVVEPENTESETAEKAKKENGFAFSFLIKLGAGTELNEDLFGDIGNLKTMATANAELGLEFKNIVSSKHVGLTLRVDLGVDFNPIGDDWTQFEDVKAIFNPYNYFGAYHADIAALIDFKGGPVNFYLGGGAGFSITTALDDADSYLYELHTLYDFELGGVGFRTAWYPKGIVGLRFYIGNVFSIGLEGTYRYYMPAQEHLVDANLVLGFTF